MREDVYMDNMLKELLEKMTIEEKIREISMYSLRHLTENGSFSTEKADAYFNGKGIGCMEDPRESSEDTARICSDFQNYIKKKTRLGIPAIILSECLHGFMSPGATSFPQAIALACSWNPELVRRIAETIAREASACGIVQALSPVLDVARDPRWGRTEETYGEDPYLCGIMGSNFIKGLQGDSWQGDSYNSNGVSYNYRLINKNHIAATAKHFVAHGLPEGGLNLSPACIGERELRSIFVQPFKMAVEAGVISVMPAYNEIDGIPCHANYYLLQDMLRNELGFDGYIISDFEGIRMLHDFHRVVSSPWEAGVQALKAGVDIEAPGVYAFNETFIELVRQGKIDIMLINRAVKNVLKAKYRTGLLSNDYFTYDKNEVSKVNCMENKMLAYKAACESVVMLKNKDGILPIDSNIKTIAVIGPNADNPQLGGYSMFKEDSVPVLQGIIDRFGREKKIIYEKGCGIYEQSKKDFDKAVKAAEAADIAILVVGETSIMQKGKGWGQNKGDVAISGEGYDRCELNLPGVQEELVKTILDTGTPIIVILINGRPLSIPFIAEKAHAIIEAWYPGEQGGYAIADILKGDVNPSGKLCISFPKSVGQIPVYYNYKPSARGYYKRPGTVLIPGRDYVFSDTEPLYRFGFGLSYTQFKYSELNIRPLKRPWDGKVIISVCIENVGPREGMETVQLYVNDVVSSVTTPVWALKCFEKVRLMPGERKKVYFNLGFDELSLLDRDMRRIIEPGIFEVSIGGLVGKFEIL